MKEGDDPRTMVFKRQESNGEGEKNHKYSFYYQQEHAAKSVDRDHEAKSDVGDTICTEEDMKVVNKKGDMRY